MMADNLGNESVDTHFSSSSLYQCHPNNGNITPTIESSIYLAFLRFSIDLWWIMLLFISVLVTSTWMQLLSSSKPLLSFLQSLWTSDNVLLSSLKNSKAFTSDLLIPSHIAVIMDGNRRYGKAKYGISQKGHQDGSKTLVNFVEWCMKAGVNILTVYAFSTENWNREASEIATLLGIFEKFMDDIAPQAISKNIKVRILVSDYSKIPQHIVTAIHKIQELTSKCDGFTLNVCVSYGSRNEIVEACKSIGKDIKEGIIDISDINEEMVSHHLLTGGLPDPDLLIRTSGELRVSNFLLYQLAYSEFFFLDKYWPDIKEKDVHEIIHAFSTRKRRFGK